MRVEERLIEEMNLNAWPALHTVVYDGWLLRFTEGYSKRSNSVTPLYPSRLKDLAAKIYECEAIYEQNGLNPVFKITPFDSSEGLDSILEQHGYKSVDTTLVLTRGLGDPEHKTHLPDALPGHVTVDSKVSHDWLELLCKFGSLKTEYKDTAYRMLMASPLKMGFFTLYDAGEPAACGYCVIQAGYMGIYDIVSDPSRRRRGYGLSLLLSMLDWGRASGAEHAYLLVVESNHAARSLYGKLNFTQLYHYWYRVKQNE
ncbi:Acetyltransferase (GNAT) family protein [compost metagenome]